MILTIVSKDQISRGRGKRPRDSSSASPRQTSVDSGIIGISPSAKIAPVLLDDTGMPGPSLPEQPAPADTSTHGRQDLVKTSHNGPQGSAAEAPVMTMFDLFAPNAAEPTFASGTSLPLERDLDEIWRVLFGNDNPFSIPVGLSAPAPESQGQDTSPNRYLHHYLNIVLPMQFHQKSSRISDVVAPLAMSHPDVLDAVSSLAALHMGAQRTRQLCAPTDTDVIFAQATHRKTIDKLRLIPVEEFPTEQVVILAIFATSFQLFSGGTAKMWRETIAVCQRCLSIMLSRSEKYVLLADPSSGAAAVSD